MLGLGVDSGGFFLFWGCGFFVFVFFWWCSAWVFSPLVDMVFAFSSSLFEKLNTNSSYHLSLLLHICFCSETTGSSAGLNNQVSAVLKQIEQHYATAKTVLAHCYQQLESMRKTWETQRILPFMFQLSTPKYNLNINERCSLCRFLKSSSKSALCHLKLETRNIKGRLRFHSSISLKQNC